MKKGTKQNLIYACTAGACAFVVARLFQRKNKKYWVYPDHDMRNSETVDMKESPNADVDEAEIGLTELDSAYRAEWVSMGYPQTYHEVENNENWNK